MGQFVLIALGTFASEDLTCIATGALIAAGAIGFVPGVAACLAGIYAGDLLLYFAGRLAGRPVLRWKPLQKFLSEEKLDRASAWLLERGASVVVISRFTPGLRLPTYVAAGILKTRFWTFAGYFLLAAAIWTPILVGASALLGKSLPLTVFAGPALLLVAAPWRRVRSAPSLWHIRRRAAGWLRHKILWEFWPSWLSYLPLLPYLIYLGVRHRSLTLFTAVNPGIATGGFAGESKAAILAQLPHVPDFTLIPATLSAPDRIARAREFLSARGLQFPVVLKPDVGERGKGVATVRSERDLCAYLKAAIADTIVQKYAGGLEFGVFYYRYPSEPRGHIFSITEKRFPEVTGDGRRTLTDLVLADDRAACLSHLYLAGRGNEIPPRGTKVRLVDYGSHSRGAIFLDGGRVETRELRDAIDETAGRHPGVYFGRFDVRTPSVEAFQAGEFQVLELNGVTGEATHIYDPKVSLLEAYRVLFTQWRIAFEIAAENRKAGAKPTGVRELIRAVRSR